MEIREMTISDFEKIKDTLQSDFDEFWNANILKSELESENSKYIVLEENDIIFYYILDPNFQGTNVAFSRKRADTVTQVCIGDKGYLLKNDEEIMYVNEFGDILKTRVNGIDLSDTNNLIDITQKESATIYSLADDNLKKVKRVVAKHTSDRGEIVYLEAA